MEQFLIDARTCIIDFQTVIILLSTVQTLLRQKIPTIQNITKNKTV